MRRIKAMATTGNFKSEELIAHENECVLPILDNEVAMSIGEIAKNHRVSNSAVALAWLRAKGQTPIASARTLEQLKEIMQIVELSASEVSALDSVSNS